MLEDVASSNGQPKSLNEMMFKDKNVNQTPKAQNQKKFTPIASYKPQGNLVYNDELINTLESKFN